MNKTLALSAFAMFAVIMGMSAIAPAAFADHDKGEGKSQDANNAKACDRAQGEPSDNNPDNKGKSGSTPSRAECPPEEPPVGP